MITNAKRNYIYANTLYNKGTPKDKLKAIKYYKMAADKGHIKATENYIFMLEIGYEEEKDRDEAIRYYYKQLADKGFWYAINNYAYLLHELYIKNNIPEYEVEAIKYLQKLENDDDSFISDIDINNTEYNEKNVMKRIKSIADHGNLDAIYKYANILYNDNTLENKAKSASYFKKLIDKMQFVYSPLSFNYEDTIDNIEELKYRFRLIKDKRQAKIAYISNIMAYINKNVSTNEENVAKYFKMLADDEDVRSAYNYANMTYNNKKHKYKKTHAIKYYKIAANGGNINAMYKYANILYSYVGRENMRDKKIEAAKYFKMVLEKSNIYNKIKSNNKIIFTKKKGASYYKIEADKGDIDAMVQYANYAYDGWFMPKDREEAIEYYKMAANKGNIKAMKKCSVIFYYKGRKASSAKYYKMVADKGDVESIETYAEMLYYGDGVKENKKKQIFIIIRLLKM